MVKCISVSDEVYNRLEPMTNKLGGRNPRKVSFSEVINKALDDQDRLKKRKINNNLHDSSRVVKQLLKGRFIWNSGL